MTRPPQAVPVLTYHSIDPSGSVVSMHPALFREQMQWLASRGYGAITATELFDAWEGAASPPERPIVITFDDALGNVATEALPIMNALGFRATVFVVSGTIGEHNDWPEQGGGIPRLPLLSRDGLSELVAVGFEIGSHSNRHRRLTGLSPSELAGEVIDSKRALEDRLGAAVNAFAYPFGDVDGAARSLASCHYRGAFGTRLGIAGAGDDRFELPRVDMYYLRHPAGFRRFDTTIGRWYLRARAAGRRLRAVTSG